MSIKDIIIDINKQHPEFNYKGSLSVSKCIEFLKNPFDAEKVAKEQFEKYYNQEGHKYYHMSADEIIQSWNMKKDRSLSRGKLFDSYVEQIFEIREPEKFNLWKVENDIDNNEFMLRAINGFNNIMALCKQLNYTVLIGTELPLWIQLNNSPADLIINGRCDCLLYNPETQSYLIIDWKTNEKIKQTGFKQLKGPLNELSDCDYNTYMTQLFFYKKAIVETYKLADYLHVDVMICQVGTLNEQNYNIFKPKSLGYNFDTDLMNRVIKYCYSIKNYKENELSI